MGSRHWIVVVVVVLVPSSSVFVAANGTPVLGFPSSPLSVLSMRARSRNFHAQNAQIDTLFPIQEPSRLFKSRPTSRVVRFTETRRGGGGASLSILLHPRILLSLRRNQFGISVNRPLSPEEYSVSRFTVKSRSDYIGDAERGTNFYTVEGIPKRVYIYIYIYTFFFFHFSFSRRSATVSPPFPLSRTKGRKEGRKGGGAKIPISRTYDEPYYALRYLVYSNVSTLSSPPFFPSALLSASYGVESVSRKHRRSITREKRKEKKMKRDIGLSIGWIKVFIVFLN